MQDEQVKKMLRALLKSQGLTQVADGYAIGGNAGGKYVSLFSSRLQFRVCQVYAEDFKRLPDVIRMAITDEEFERDVPNDRAKAEKRGWLVACPMFEFTIWRHGEGEDVRNKFGEVLWHKRAASVQNPPPRHREPVQPPAPGDTPVPAEENPFTDPSLGALNNGRGPVRSEVRQDKVGKANLLGVSVYGDQWPAFRTKQVRRATSGHSSDLAALTPDQLDKVVEFLRGKQRETMAGKMPA